MDLPCIYSKQIRDWSHANEPDRVAERSVRSTFTRKQFYACGVNHIWAMDQHDKWRKFGLFFHIGVEVYSRKILWLRVWHTNSNPHLIAKFYFETIKEWNCEWSQIHTDVLLMYL